MYALRTMVPGDFDEVADLIYLSTNSWYQARLGHPVFTGDSSVCRVFPEVYEALDPRCGLVAEHARTGRIIGSCFTHPRETHVSLGIMNVHPNHFGAGVASSLLQRIVAYAESQDLPIRLVSSAMNLDSFSLYSRIGFTPFAAYQDMSIDVPKKGFADGGRAEAEESGEGDSGEKDDAPVSVREATLDDVEAIGAVEFEISGISRVQDYRHFIENEKGCWHLFVSEDAEGRIDGYLASIDDPGSRMIGPGVAARTEAAEKLLLAQLERFRGKRVVFLLPVNRPDIVSRMYRHGARNCEIHFGQVLGEAQPVRGIVMPSFLPESG